MGRKKCVLFLMYMMKVLGWFEIGNKKSYSNFPWPDHFFSKKTGNGSHRTVLVAPQIWRLWDAPSYSCQMRSQIWNLLEIWHDSFWKKARKGATKSPFILLIKKKKNSFYSTKRPVFYLFIYKSVTTRPFKNLIKKFSFPMDSKYSQFSFLSTR